MTGTGREAVLVRTNWWPVTLIVRVPGSHQRTRRQAAVPRIFTPPLSKNRFKFKLFMQFTWCSLIDVYSFIDFLFNSTSICTKNSLNPFIIETKAYPICNTLLASQVYMIIIAVELNICYTVLSVHNLALIYWL